jgi:hypothetical protein
VGALLVGTVLHGNHVILVRSDEVLDAGGFLV